MVISEEIIKSHGYNVSVFKNGSEAFAEFGKDPHKYDLVITERRNMCWSGEASAVLATIGLGSTAFMAIRKERIMGSFGLLCFNGAVTGDHIFLY